MTLSVEEFQQRLVDINERIARAAAKAGRSASDVTLVAVTKTHPAEVVRMAYQLGLRHFGENRVEEGEEKIIALRDDLQHSTWHMIGHLQSRKSVSAAEHFDWVHSVDRLKIGRRLSAAAGESERVLFSLVQVNISGEQTKSGYDLNGWQTDRALYANFVKQLSELASLDNLVIEGLMTLAPYTDDPETVRPVFRDLRQLRDSLKADLPDQPWAHLSMGMSGDFEVAIEEGATMVRLGTSLFGPRRP